MSERDLLGCSASRPSPVNVGNHHAFRYIVLWMCAHIPSPTTNNTHNHSPTHPRTHPRIHPYPHMHPHLRTNLLSGTKLLNRFSLLASSVVGGTALTRHAPWGWGEKELRKPSGTIRTGRRTVFAGCITGKNTCGRLGQQNRGRLTARVGGTVSWHMDCAAEAPGRAAGRGTRQTPACMPWLVYPRARMHAVACVRLLQPGPVFNSSSLNL